jgi:hypothetical protein
VRDATFFTSSLLDLDKVDTAAERRATWRQSMAALARASTEDGPGPLEGLNPQALLGGVRAALAAGLADDLDWLAPAAAGAALYELASALPVGPEQRELGRRVLARLLGADAEGFVAIARRMALAGGKGLGSSSLRARVALVAELPVGAGVADGPLALALVGRRDAARDWIVTPSTGSLPSRRLAARLLERAAREAALRATRGDEHSLRLFGGEAIAAAWDRLLTDRESLVWRHIAVARGLLAPWVPAMNRAIDAALAPTLSPTEWRRGAASLAAMIAVAPEKGLEGSLAALSRGLLDRDPGAAAGVLWGLPRAAELEPEAAQTLLERVLERAQPDIAESVVDFCNEMGPSPLVDYAARRALALISGKGRPTSDDGAVALASQIARDLQTRSDSDEPVRAQIAAALKAFATEGAKQAYGLARGALSAASASVDALEAVSREEDGASTRAGSIARRTALAVLRDLDLSLLEHDALAHLLLLNDPQRGVDDAIDGFRERMGTWILAREASPIGENAAADALAAAHPTLALRRLRALLHLADGDAGDSESDPARVARAQRRIVRIAQALLARFERGPASPVRRTIVAALARSLDALVRIGACDRIDALLLVVRKMADPAEFLTLAEASMDPDLVHLFQRYAMFAEAVGRDARGALGAYGDMVRNLVPDDSSRSEALRAVLVRLGAGLNAIASAPSLRTFAADGPGELGAIASVEAALASLAQVVVGARVRLDPEGSKVSLLPAARPLTVAVTRVLSGSEPALKEPVVAASLDVLLAGTPGAIAKLVSAILWRLVELPKENANTGGAASDDPRAGHPSAGAIKTQVDTLPPWLPPRRTIGGFYILRGLSEGAAGSVFVATRFEDKGDDNAERFALKVPEFSATVARSLSEAEFLTMFRQEAAALLELPRHPNLARFVLFDDASKPKPSLVMELVEGTTLERLIEARNLDSARVLQILDDVLCGLQAMHAVGVAHLDLKPSNVVLRKGTQAVLVDFGLAGRRIRPGCATGPYGAPEVWGVVDGMPVGAPAQADMYAFGCVAFEALTGRVLFDAPNEMAQIALHVGHDGAPPPVRALAKAPDLAGLIELLFGTLRRSPVNRPTAARARSELAKLAPALRRKKWPLGG